MLPDRRSDFQHGFRHAFLGTLSIDTANLGSYLVHLRAVCWRWKPDLGEVGLQPRSRRPGRHPAAVSNDIKATVIALRAELEAAGLDAGAESIADRLQRQGFIVPSVSTIWRILRSAALVVPQPQKRPRSSWHRFEAAQPNQTWQSDFTHWTLAGGVDVEVISWLDDCSRYLLHISTHPRVSGAFEYLLKKLGITQKYGSPYHPQTQGKIERFHQTLKKWHARQPPGETCHDLDQQLARFQHIYNEERPHRPQDRKTSAEVYASLSKAAPVASSDRHWRVRYDKIDGVGTVSLRYESTMRHLAIGRAHKGKHVTMLINGPEVMIADALTGELLAEHTIDPSKNYQPKK